MTELHILFSVVCFVLFLLEGENEIPKANGLEGHLTVSAAVQRIQGSCPVASVGNGGQVWLCGGCKGKAVHAAGARSSEALMQCRVS